MAKVLGCRAASRCAAAGSRSGPAGTTSCHHRSLARVTRAVGPASSSSRTTMMSFSSSMMNSVNSGRRYSLLQAPKAVPEPEDDIVEFGYSRKDVIFLCTLPLVGGYATYYGLQKFAGLNPIEAGNYVQVIFVFVLCVAWCGSYLFRVGTKNMTYTQQLKDYEEAVMEKRLAEMSDTEIEEILSSGKTPEEIYREEKKA